MTYSFFHLYHLKNLLKNLQQIYYHETKNQTTSVSTAAANTEKSVSIKQESLQALPLLVGEGKILNNEEMEKIKKIFENIPDKTTFIHGDSHPGNIMYKNGKYFL